MIPRRIQLSRVRGFRLPPNTRSVARPGPFGNPFKPLNDSVEGRRLCVESFREVVTEFHSPSHPRAFGRAERHMAKMAARLHELCGMNLACWCQLPADGEPDYCHAAVLLEFANPVLAMAGRFAGNG